MFGQQMLFDEPYRQDCDQKSILAHFLAHESAQLLY